ncbi:hypothetical protein GCM10010378_30920 [Streptomyces viridochromogenes]
MYGDDSGRPRTDDRVHGSGVQAVRHRVYVGEHGQRTRQHHGFGQLDVPEGRYDDLVTDTYAGGPEHCSSTHVMDAARDT